MGKRPEASGMETRPSLKFARNSRNSELFLAYRRYLPRFTPGLPAAFARYTLFGGPMSGDFRVLGGKFFPFGIVVPSDVRGAIGFRRTFGHGAKIGSPSRLQ